MANPEHLSILKQGVEEWNKWRRIILVWGRPQQGEPQRNDPHVGVPERSGLHRGALGKWNEHMKKSQLDAYAKEARAWRDWAKINHVAADALFDLHNPSMYFPAATLGHHSLEMYLKAALICAGLTVYDPKKVRQLDPAIGLTAADCVWGHGLVDLAQQLSASRQNFDVTAKLNVPDLSGGAMPNTIKSGLELFDPFFSELRYPQELKQLRSVGREERVVLDRLVALLLPFAE